MKLFSETFDPVLTDEALSRLCKDFPKYDPAYLCQASAKLREKTKNWMEDLWMQYEPYADQHFLTDFKIQFTQRSWELYLGAVFLGHGFNLGTNKGEGPDFDLLDKSNNRIAWVEAIAVTKGSGDDKVPETFYNFVGSVPTEEINLRLSSGLNTKYKKYSSDCKNKFIEENEPYVIAIDRSELGHVDSTLPNILKVLFGIGDPALRMRIGGLPVENPEMFWTRKETVEKKNGEPIPMLFFENPEHAGISAVIYSKDHVINSPRGIKEIGQNFFIVHNPLAKNPLPKGVFPFGTEYVAEDGFIKISLEKEEYTKPDPFEFLEG